MPEEQTQCENITCGKEFSRWRKSQRYCSPKCRHEAWRIEHPAADLFKRIQALERKLAEYENFRTWVIQTLGNLERGEIKP